MEKTYKIEFELTKDQWEVICWALETEAMNYEDKELDTSIESIKKYYKERYEFLYSMMDKINKVV